MYIIKVENNSIYETIKCKEIEELMQVIDKVDNLNLDIIEIRRHNKRKYAYKEIRQRIFYYRQKNVITEERYKDIIQKVKKHYKSE